MVPAIASTSGSAGTPKFFSNLPGLIRPGPLFGQASRSSGIYSFGVLAYEMRFYGHLRQGKSKDEALRSAQKDLLRGKAFAHSYYWAAFQLTGDWR